MSEEKPYLHVRPPRRVVGVDGEDGPLAKVYGNRAGLLQPRDRVDAALAAEERSFELFVQRADGRSQVGEDREPDPPGYSILA